MRGRLASKTACLALLELLGSRHPLLGAVMVGRGRGRQGGEGEAGRGKGEQQQTGVEAEGGRVDGCWGLG